jgi:hypothetical protein
MTLPIHSKPQLCVADDDVRPFVVQDGADVGTGQWDEIAATVCGIAAERVLLLS